MWLYRCVYLFWMSRNKSIYLPWDLWWRKWHWAGFLPKCWVFGFLMPVTIIALSPFAINTSWFIKISIEVVMHTNILNQILSYEVNIFSVIKYIPRPLWKIISFPCSSWSCSQAVSKPVWHKPLLCVQWRTPDDGQRNCPKYVEFYSKNKFEKLVHLVGFNIRKGILCFVPAGVHAVSLSNMDYTLVYGFT